MKVKPSPFEKSERNFSIYVDVIVNHRNIIDVAKEHRVSPAAVKNAIINVYKKQCVNNHLAPLGWTIKAMRSDHRFEPSLRHSDTN